MLPWAATELARSRAKPLDRKKIKNVFAAREISNFLIINTTGAQRNSLLTAFRVLNHETNQTT